MRLTSAVAIATLVAGAGVARSQPSKADEKFKLGKKLLAQKRYADACAAFEDSNKLDPGIGAELNIGHCYEEWGKLATAYRAYLAGADMAKQSHDPRLPKIKERMDALDPQVPRLTIEVGKDASTKGLVIELDGAPFAKSDLGIEQRVDPGPHKLEYRIGDSFHKDKLIPLERGGSSEVTLDLPKPDEGTAIAADKPAVTKPDPTTTEPKDGGAKDTRVYAVSPGHRRHVEGVIAMSVGVVGMGAAGFLTVQARSKYKDALAADCGGVTTMCDAQGLTDTHDARHDANVASIVFGAGAAVALTGIILYATAPGGHAIREHSDEEARLRVVPVASPDSAGLVVFGRF